MADQDASSNGSLRQQSLAPPLAPEQCRMARAMLNMPQDRLAELSHVAKRTIVEFEQSDRVDQPRLPHERTLRDLRRALERAGAVFIADDEDGGAGVRRAVADLRIEQISASSDPVYRVHLAGTFRDRDAWVSLHGSTLDALDDQRPNFRRTSRALLDSFRRHQRKLLPIIDAALAANQADAQGRLDLTPEAFVTLFSTELEQPMSDITLGAPRVDLTTRRVHLDLDYRGRHLDLTLHTSVLDELDGGASTVWPTTDAVVGAVDRHRGQIVQLVANTITPTALTAGALEITLRDVVPDVIATP